MAVTTPTMQGRLGRTALELDGASLRVRDVLEVSRRGRTVRLSERAARAVSASKQLKDELIAKEIPIYGVTTGFGDSAHRQISPGKAARLQQNIMRFMGVGTGPIAPPEVARATMVLRANCLSKGNSGVRVELIERVLDLLNNDVVPFIPERGSVGASGDLAPLSYVGRALSGDGVVAFEGVEREAADVLAELGLEPILMEAKEGLALTNGTSFMSAFACMAVAASQELADLADLLTAMASEAMLGNRGHFNAFLFDEAKPHPGMVTSARHIRELLADSRLAADSDELFEGGMGGAGFVELDRQVQDKYSIRCAPHVTGVLRDVLEWAERWLTIEINSSDDNPLFNVAGGRVESGGNFYGGHVGQAMDSLKVALANLCDLIDRQVELLVDEKFNRGLTAEPDPALRADRSRGGAPPRLQGHAALRVGDDRRGDEALQPGDDPLALDRVPVERREPRIAVAVIEDELPSVRGECGQIRGHRIHKRLAGRQSFLIDVDCHVRRRRPENTGSG